jgi:RimJ/RimL family protein N-acetyltransferase
MRVSLTHLDIMRLHLEAEFTQDAAGELVSTNEPAATVAPRFYFGHTASGHLVRFRRDVPAASRRALDNALDVVERASSGPDQPLDPAPFERILARDAPIELTSVGIAFRFPRSLPQVGSARILRDTPESAMLHPLLATWAPDIRSSPPLVTFVVDGQAVAVCGSVRITPRAHEAGVETPAPFRGRGYGKLAVAAWATAVGALEAEPLYSTTWQNDASRGIARTLGLVPMGGDVHIR